MPPDWECAHQRSRLTCDYTPAVECWYVECLDCGGAGPTAASDTEALAAWRELVEVLDLWHAAADGDLAAAREVRAAVGTTCRCDRPGSGCSGACELRAAIGLSPAALLGAPTLKRGFLVRQLLLPLADSESNEVRP